MTSTLKADVLTSKTTNGDLTISGDGSGVPNLEAGFKVGGVAGVPGASIRNDAIDSQHYAAASIDLEHMSSESVDEDNIHISNAGSNGEFLSKQSGAAGGLTWAAAGGGGFTVGTEQATASGTSFTFTGIPSGTTMVILTFASISMTSTDAFDVTIGDSGGLETSSYNANSIHIDNNTAAGVGNASAFLMKNHHALRKYSGSMILMLEDATNHTWVCSSVFGGSDGAGDSAGISGGSKTLSDELTQISLSGGTFDAGACNIMYQ
jgi:hypothetical protein|tara:strand:+ start:1416 stop:2207 length:792 start_codon:yes stop_codon:yes gene_type:complete